MFAVYIYSFVLSPCLLLHSIRCWRMPIGTFPMKHSHFGESLCCRNKFFTTIFFSLNFFFSVRWFFFRFVYIFLVFGLLFSCDIYLSRRCICWKPLYFFLFYLNGASTLGKKSARKKKYQIPYTHTHTPKDTKDTKKNASNKNANWIGLPKRNVLPIYSINDDVESDETRKKEHTECTFNFGNCK